MIDGWWLRIDGWCCYLEGKLSVLLVSCFTWSGASESLDLLLSHNTIRLAYNISIILISTLFYIFIYLYINVDHIIIIIIILITLIMHHALQVPMQGVLSAVPAQQSISSTSASTSTSTSTSTRSGQTSAAGGAINLPHLPQVETHSGEEMYVKIGVGGARMTRIR